MGHYIRIETSHPTTHTFHLGFCVVGLLNYPILGLVGWGFWALVRKRVGDLFKPIPIIGDSFIIWLGTYWFFFTLDLVNTPPLWFYLGYIFIHWMFWIFFFMSRNYENYYLFLCQHLQLLLSSHIQNIIWKYFEYYSKFESKWLFTYKENTNSNPTFSHKNK
jgi:hypothetical protein